MDNYGIELQIQDSVFTCNDSIAIVFPPKTEFVFLLDITVKISSAFVAMGLIFNALGIGICGGSGFKGTLFANYLGFYLFYSIVLIIAIHGRISFLFVYTHPVNNIDDGSCVDMYYFSLWSEHAAWCSFCLLCINRTREQHEKHFFDNYIDTLRWPFLLNVIAGLMCVIPVMHYKISRDYVNRLTMDDIEQCITAFVRPFCTSNEDWFMSNLPLIEYIFLVILLIVLTAEMLYKKRQWRKKANFLAVNKHTYNNLMLPEDAGLDEHHSLDKQSTTSQFDRNRWVGFLQTAPSNMSMASRKSSVKQKSFQASDTMNVTLPVAKTTMCLALLVMVLLFRLPRTLIGITFLPADTFLYRMKHEELARLVCDLIFQFSLVLPVFVCFAASPYYRVEAKRVFAEPTCKQDPLLTPFDAKEIYAKLHRRPTWAVPNYESNHSVGSNMTMPFRQYEDELTQSLTSKVEQISRQRDILEVLAHVKSYPEYPELEQFSHTDTFINPSENVASAPNSTSSMASSPSLNSNSAEDVKDVPSNKGVIFNV